ncbi:MAG TPA: hypothetical protein PKE04_02185, partial [Clostridia bacterium]|nr:hypothetical protein [Clostridia bacterium]
MNRGRRESMGTWTAMRRILAYLGKGAPITWFCVLIWASQDFLGNYLVALFNRNLVAAVTEGAGMGPAFRAVGLYVGMQLLYTGSFALGMIGMFYWTKRMRNALESDLLNRLLRAARPRPSAERVALFV